MSMKLVMKCNGLRVDVIQYMSRKTALRGLQRRMERRPADLRGGTEFCLHTCDRGLWSSLPVVRVWYDGDHGCWMRHGDLNPGEVLSASVVTDLMGV